MKKLLILLGAWYLLVTPHAAFAENGNAAPEKPASPKTEWSTDEAYEIGVDYATNHDYGSAFQWFQRAADGGNPRAQSDLAFMYAQGLGTEQDHAMALNWYTRAAEEGLPDAQTNLAVMHLNGLGTPVDVSEAYKWLKLAAEEGQTEGIELLEALDQELTREQIAEGLRRAEAWLEKTGRSAKKTTRAK